MTREFRALRIHSHHDTAVSRIETLTIGGAPAPGEVTIAARYSSVNYKDALAATGRGKILRRSPLTGGVDVAGEVSESRDARFAEGDAVLVTGCGMSEDHDGGYAEYVRVPADWVVPVPAGMTLREAMALGTAGLTVALAVQRLEENGQEPSRGPLLVTGATGGVGSIAIDILSARGYEVVALTGKPEGEDYLGSLGACRVLDRNGLDMGQRALEQGQWGGAIDSVGGAILAWLTRTVRPWGNIASIGMAGGTELHTTVMPFILRGVSVIGVTSANCPMARRTAAWTRLAGDLRPRHLDRIVTDVVTLDTLSAAFDRLLEGTNRGRILVEITSARP
jgi:acrylyl-CoA reductase (NADPH)